MPKKRVKSKRKTTLTEFQLFDLVLMDRLDEHDPHHTFKDEAHRKQAWLDHKEEILKYEENKHCGAWWQYDSGLGHYPDNEEEWLKKNYKKEN
jgi:hypothetical protein